MHRHWGVAILNEKVPVFEIGTAVESTALTGRQPFDDRPASLISLGRGARDDRNTTTGRRPPTWQAAQAP